MSDPVERELARAPLPGVEPAAERAWPVVRDAYRAREPVRLRRRLPVLALAVLALAGTLTAIAFTPPGRAAADWLRDRVGRSTVRELPAAPGPPPLARLPAPGRLLVTAPSGVWVVRQSGARRLLGPYTGAGWSPNGLFVVAWHGRTLTTLEPGSGHTRWTLTAPAPIRAAAWAGPDGVLIAYLAGSQLRLVEGDGDHDRPLAARVAPVAPTWRPGRHQLAYLDQDGLLHLHDADTGRDAWPTRVPADTVALAWSADGETLLVTAPHALTLLDPGGQVLRRLTVPAATITSASLGPSGGSVAYATLAPDGASAVHLLDQPTPLFAGAGRILDLHQSPNGRWLIASWPDTDQWLLLATTYTRALRTATHVSASFRASADDPAPALEGWCCAR